MLFSFRKPTLAPRWAALALALWCAGPLNQALWRQLGSLPDFVDPWGAKRLALGLLVACATYLWFMLWSWPVVRRPAWTLMLLIAGVCQFYMLHYGTLMDPGMLRNTIQTNPAEAAALLTPGLLLHVLVYAGLPALWLWCGVRWPARPLRQWWWRSALAVLAGQLLLVSGGVAMYRQLAPLLRNHTDIRYRVNPLAAITSWANVVLKPIVKPPKPFVAINDGAVLGASYAKAGSKPPLLILVVGETGRSGNFGINGYGRNTTPQLQARDAWSWRNVQSCGTNTLASVPCMFSPLGKRGYETRKADYGNLLDVLQAAGLAVDWLDNQAGCKGVCQRIPHAQADAVASPDEVRRWCQDGECLDRLMIGELDARLATLPQTARQHGAVLVLHQMGSHGPAYYRRSAPDAKRFMPECNTNVTSDCDRDALVNVYDNSIAEIDLFLGQAIDWLKAKEGDWDVGMMYVADHGESLGEKGIYLHGLPYAIAPWEQKHVPWVLWPGDLTARTDVNAACVRSALGERITHDSYFHTVLGLLDVQTPRYQRGLDILAACRR